MESSLLSIAPCGLAFVTSDKYKGWKGNLLVGSLRFEYLNRSVIEETKNEFKYDTKRLKHVLNTAAKNAGWGKNFPLGYGQGVAVHYSFLSYVSCVVEIIENNENPLALVNQVFL